MVLTNFECWAHGGNANDVNSVVANSTNRSGMDLFNPRAVSHISSNGYYGFSHINDAAAAAAVAHERQQQQQQQDPHDNNNNNNNNINNNNRNIISNNSISLNQTLATATTMANSVNAGYNAVRCKKRFYEDGGNNNIELGVFLNGTTSPAAAAEAAAAAINAAGAVAAKRCRYDDEADMAAQYCNDFFSLPMMTQIGTQSCLMDIEDHHSNPQQCHQPELQVYTDEAMTIAHSPQSTTPNQSSTTEQLQQQQQQQHPHQQQQQQQQQHNHHHQYHHNQHYQGHLHRANRDVSRCMMSHMI